eukprot:scaffold177066_cov32-Tisochrysis_lutea.AAC.5
MTDPVSFARRPGCCSVLTEDCPAFRPSRAPPAPPYNLLAPRIVRRGDAAFNRLEATFAPETEDESHASPIPPRLLGTVGGRAGGAGE